MNLNITVNPQIELLMTILLTSFAAGYGLWDECVNKHIIRAVAIYLCDKFVDKEASNKRLKFDILNSRRIE
jgi:hypothetical protein